MAAPSGFTAKIIFIALFAYIVDGTVLRSASKLPASLVHQETNNNQLHPDVTKYSHGILSDTGEAASNYEHVQGKGDSALDSSGQNLGKIASNTIGTAVGGGGKGTKGGNNLPSSVDSQLSGLTSSVNGAGSKSFQTVGHITDSSGSGVGGVGGQAKNIVNQVGSVAGGGIPGHLGSIGSQSVGGLTGSAGGLTGTVGGATNGVSHTLGHAGSGLSSQTLNSVTGSLGGATSQVGGVLNQVGPLGGGGGTLLNNLLGSVNTVGSSCSKSSSDLTNSAGNGVGDASGEAHNIISSLGSQSSGGIAGLPGNILGSVNSGVGAISSQVGSSVNDESQMLDDESQIINDAGSAGYQELNSLMGSSGGEVNGVQGQISPTVNTVSGAANKAVGGAFNVVKGQGASGGVLDHLGSIQKIIKNPTNLASQAVGSTDTLASGRNGLTHGSPLNGITGSAGKIVNSCTNTAGKTLKTY